MKLSPWLAGLIMLAPAAAMASPWKFIVTGDGRSGKNRPEDKNGVNVMIMAELAKAIVDEKPKFLLFSGDLVAGPKTDEEMESQVSTWLDAMKPVYDAGIKVYAIRGNHEMHVPHPEAVWRKKFVGPYAMPENGPKGEEGMTFTATYENVRIIGLDEFQGDEAKINQPWLDSVLKANTSEHIFTFAHKMAFRSGNHDDGMEVNAEARDTFVKSLVSGGEKVMFFGHDHLYDHLTASLSAEPDKSIHQFVLGTAGAPLVHGKDNPGNNSIWTVKRIQHIEDKYGYAVVEIDGHNVSITFKARTAPGVYETADTYSYSVK